MALGDCQIPEPTCPSGSKFSIPNCACVSDADAASGLPDSGTDSGDSGTPDATIQPQDSGTPDVNAQTVADSSVADGAGDPDADDAAVCRPDASLVTVAPVDAALDDAGASVGTCLGCLKTSCGSQVSACNEDCACNGIFDCVFECLASVGASFEVCYLECGGSPTGGGNTLETALGTCTLGSCATECAQCSVSPAHCATDAGTPVDGG